MSDEYSRKGFGYGYHDIERIIHDLIYPVNFSKVINSEFENYVTHK
jgi:hypothetical protein